MSFWIKALRAGLCCACKPAVCDPCVCPLPTLKCDSVSATKSKCGFYEWPGHASTPLKIYKTKTQSGSLTNSPSTSGSTKTTTWAGSIAYTTPDCTTSDDRSVHVDDDFYGPPCNVTLTASDCGSCANADDPSGGSYNGNFVNEIVGCTGNPTIFYGPGDSFVGFSSTTLAVIADQTNFSGSVQVLLSDEYTSLQLRTDTIAALPAYPGTFVGTCSSLFDQTSDEFTFTVRRFKYKFVLPSMTGITCYTLTWLEGTTPKSYTWNGTDTETPVYGPVLEPPGTGGTATRTISSIAASCVC